MARESQVQSEDGRWTAYIQSWAAAVSYECSLVLRDNTRRIFKKVGKVQLAIGYYDPSSQNSRVPWARSVTPGIPRFTSSGVEVKVTTTNRYEGREPETDTFVKSIPFLTQKR